MAEERSRTSSRFVLGLLALVVALIVLGAGCQTSAPSSEQVDTSAPTPLATATAVTGQPPEVTPASVEPTVAAPAPTTESRQPELAPLGSYVVARSGAGQRWVRHDGFPELQIPVFDEPGSEPRTMLYVNEIDGNVELHPLFNWTEFGSPTVLRLLAGGPGDEWIKVQAPTRPHNRSMWVRSADFTFGFTDRRIEIDLADPGSLVVYDADRELLRTDIVHGRAERPTPVHLTYLEGGHLGEYFAPAYGYAVLSIASFSESLGSFGSRGGAPENYVHGTNQPELMGQRVSSGEIRVPNEALVELIDLVVPGTPVLLFKGSPAAILAEPQLAVATVPADTARGVTLAAERVHPQLWLSCDGVARSCPNPDPTQRTEQHRYAIATNLTAADQIPVYDHVNGPQRTLLDVNEVDGTTQMYPLFARTPWGGPLLLRVIESTADDAWLKLQVPVRPNNSHVWVRASDFEVRSTSIRVEVRTGFSPEREAGDVTVYDHGDPIFSAPIASGRPERATPLMTGWIAEFITGPDRSPAYGPWVIDIGGHSEALGSFGSDGGMPRMVFHGTNQPETIGQRVSSGALRLRNDQLDQMQAIEGLLGAPVTILDTTRDDDALPQFFPTWPASTTEWSPNVEPPQVTPL